MGSAGRRFLLPWTTGKWRVMQTRELAEEQVLWGSQENAESAEQAKCSSVEEKIKAIEIRIAHQNLQHRRGRGNLGRANPSTRARTQTDTI